MWRVKHAVDVMDTTDGISYVDESTPIKEWSGVAQRELWRQLWRR